VTGAALLLIAVAILAAAAGAHLRERARKRELVAIGVELMRAGWHPAHEYPCGCYPSGLCQAHAAIRASIHYRRPGAAS